MDLSTGTFVQERYRVRGLLGRGGMASVYLAWDERLRIEVALKVLHVPAAAIQERLLQEGRVQASLRHPNVLNVTDIVDVAGCPGLVMELVQGPSLDALLARTLLVPGEAGRLARGILAGVRAAHEAGVIHRDLKPGNVLLATVDGELVPKVADFGLVKLLGPEGGSGTRSGLPMGTPPYMAPEQIRGVSDIDQRADLFSLGAVLYELFTGTRAFPGDDVLAIFDAVQAGRWTRRSDLPDPVSDAIAGCLAPDRADRIASCDALLAMLDIPALQGGWRPEVVALASELRPSAVAVQDVSGSETWAASLAGPPPVSTGPPSGVLPPASAPDRPRGSTWIALGLVLLGLLGAAALWPRAGQPLRPGEPPPLAGTDDQALRLATQGWQEILDNEDLDAMAHLDQALARAPEEPTLYLMRAALDLGFHDWDGFARHVVSGAQVAHDSAGPVDSLLRSLSAGVRAESELGWLARVLAEHLDRWPDDFLARHLWISAMTLASEGLPYDGAVVEDQLRRHPTVPLSHVGALYARMAHEGPAAALETGQAALALHPQTTALEGGVAMALLKLGRPEQAQEHAERCLRQDPAWVECRNTLARAALIRGDEEAWRRARRSMSGEDMALDARRTFYLQTSRTLADRGRLLEADVNLALTRQLDPSETPSKMLLRKQSELVAVALYPGASSPAQLDHRLRQLDRSLAVPGLTPHHRQKPGVWSQLAHGVIAARAGRLDEARGTQEALGDDVSAWRLGLELAAAEGDRAALAATGKSCAPPLYAGLLLGQQGDPEARSLLERAVSGEGCRETMALERGLAHGDLALSSDGEAATAHLARFREHWPRPGVEVPLVGELVAAFGAGVVAPGALGDWVALQPKAPRVQVVADRSVAGALTRLLEDAGVAVGEDGPALVVRRRGDRLSVRLGEGPALEAPIGEGRDSGEVLEAAVGVVLAGAR